MQLVLATNNEDKITEIRHALEDLPITLFTRRDFLDFPDPEEVGDTLDANAILKARAIQEAVGLPALADDSALEVDALNGAPGVYSSRFAGPQVTYEENRRKLLEDMAAVPDECRTARFRCVMALCWSADDVITAEGHVEGMISRQEVGRSGFGYDPIFYYPPLGRHFAELSLAEKNRISHRGRALAAVRNLIVARLNHGR